MAHFDRTGGSRHTGTAAPPHKNIQETQSFIYPAYQALAERVLAHGRRQGWGLKVISEIERNLERGKLSCDWWNSEKTCGLRAQAASSRAERNYWITMRLLVQASLNRLP